MVVKYKGVKKDLKNIYNIIIIYQYLKYIIIKMNSLYKRDGGGQESLFEELFALPSKSIKFFRRRPSAGRPCSNH